MDFQTRFFHYILKGINAKKRATVAILHPRRRKSFQYPASLKKFRPEMFFVNDRAVVTFISAENENSLHIIFLHGGAFTAEEQSGHWHLAGKILKKLPCKFSFIQYPLAPEHHFRQTHEMVLKAYSELTLKYPKDRFCLLGDSAGGGLALALAQIIRDTDSLQKPEKTALLSPWLDLSLSNPEIAEMEPHDLLLSVNSLKQCAEWYAAGANLKTPALSPLFGNLNDLNSVAVFVGTKEIFLPDCRRLKEKMGKSNTALFYKEYREMQHDWILFPINESRILLEELLWFLRN